MWGELWSALNGSWRSTGFKTPRCEASCVQHWVALKCRGPCVRQPVVCLPVVRSIQHVPTVKHARLAMAFTWIGYEQRLLMELLLPWKDTAAERIECRVAHILIDKEYSNWLAPEGHVKTLTHQTLLSNASGGEARMRLSLAPFKLFGAAGRRQNEFYYGRTRDH